MMARDAINYNAIAAAGVFVAAAVLVVGWRLSIRNESAHALQKESWQRIKEEYPIPSAQVSEVTVPTETFTAFLAANPFSSERRRISASPPESGAAGGPGQEAAPAAPKFVYKGSMQVGLRQRAILEDSSSAKTYFLEVGQGVANFKVLDIDEKRVILSDPQTHEEVTVFLASATGP